MDNHSNRPDSVPEKSTDQFHSPMENPVSVDDTHTLIAATPTNVTIADIDTDDTPIRFRVCPSLPSIQSLSFI